MEQNTRRFDACIFDLDGTLANTLTSIAHFGNATLGEFGLPEIPVEQYKQLVGNGARFAHAADAENRGGAVFPGGDPVLPGRLRPPL